MSILRYSSLYISLLSCLLYVFSFFGKKGGVLGVVGCGDGRCWLVLWMADGSGSGCFGA